MQQLRQLAAARAYSEQVLLLRNNGHARSRAFGQLRLAAILVSQGEVEHACNVAQAALASSERLSSGRVTQLVHSLHTQLVTHVASPGVDQVVDALAAAATRRAHARLLIAATGNSGT